MKLQYMQYKRISMKSENEHDLKVRKYAKHTNIKEHLFFLKVNFLGNEKIENKMSAT